MKLNNEMVEAYKQVLNNEVPTAGEYMKEDSNVKVDEIASAVETATSDLKYQLKRTIGERDRANDEIRVLYKIIGKLMDKDF